MARIIKEGGRPAGKRREISPETLEKIRKIRESMAEKAAERRKASGETGEGEAAKKTRGFSGRNPFAGASPWSRRGRSGSDDGSDAEGAEGESGNGRHGHRRGHHRGFPWLRRLDAGWQRAETLSEPQSEPETEPQGESK